MKRKITVYVDGFPEGADEEDVAIFTMDALLSWGGQKRPPGGDGPDDPGDPLFNSLDAIAIQIGDRLYER